MRALTTFGLALTSALYAAPAAAAAGSTPVPEPSNLAIFALGILGVVVGRQAAKRRADDDRD